MARLLADEDLPRAVTLRLRALGHDVLTVLEAGLANVGTPDSPILAYASERGRTVVTHNRRDFRRLHRRAHLHTGIVICTRDDDHGALAQRIHDALQEDPELHGVLIRVTKGEQSRSYEK